MTGTKRYCIHLLPVRIGAALLACLMLTACSLSSDTGSSDAAQAFTLLQSGSYSEAAAAYGEIISSGKDTEANYRYLGIAYMGAGDYESAAAALESALDKAGILPSDMEYDINYYLASCYYRLGRYEDALEVYDAIVTLRPGAADAYQLRGAVRLQLGDEEGMLEDFSKAMELDPTDYDRLISIYEVLSGSGYGDEGLLLLNDALEQYADSMSSYDLGRVSYYAGEYESARIALEQLDSTSDPAVALMLGRTYEALGDYNYAASIYENYLAADASDASVYNQLGICCLKMDDYEGALEAFQSGKAIGDTSALQSLSFNEIVAYEYLEEFETAAELMEAYIAAYPGDASAKREYIFLSTR